MFGKVMNHGQMVFSGIGILALRTEPDEAQNEVIDYQYNGFCGQVDC